MARFVVLSLAAASLASSFPHVQKPPFLTLDFVVNFVDGLTNDHHDLQLCILGALQPVADAVDVVEDKAALHDRNYTEFLTAFDALDAFLHDVQPAVVACDKPLQDGKADLKVLSNFSSIRDIIQHVKHDFAGDDQDRIMASFEAAFQAYFRKDYASFGTDLGTALYRLVIAPRYPDEKKHSLGSMQRKLLALSSTCRFNNVGNVIDFVVSIVDGLTNNHNDLQQCILGSVTPVFDAIVVNTAAHTAIHDRNFTEFLEVIGDVEQLVTDLRSAEAGCKKPVEDVKLDLTVLSNISSFSDLMHHIKSDFSADAQDFILAEFEGAFQAFFRGDCAGFGTALGTALYRMVISAQYPDEVVVV